MPPGSLVLISGDTQNQPVVPVLKLGLEHIYPWDIQVPAPRSVRIKFHFSWAQSDQGKIWVDLLTDTRPQYVELQSGRLFNQNMTKSVMTPFKQTLFSPYGTDEWNEYWIPFAQIGDDVNGLTLNAAVNVETSGKRMRRKDFPSAGPCRCA